MYKKFLVTVLFLLLFLTGCTKTPIEYEWNILIYMAVNNNLERFAIRDIKQMEKIGSTNKVNVLVLVDWWGVYSKGDGSMSTQLYRIKKDRNNSEEIISELILDYGELDMTDPKTLIEFVTFSSNKYNAKKTLLSFYTHGYGVYPRGIQTQGLGLDYTTGAGIWDVLTIDEIRFALAEIKEKTRKMVNVVNMDVCLMQMLELAYELKGYTNYLIASQVLVPGRGNDYKLILEYLNENPNIKEIDLAAKLIDIYANKYSSGLYSTALSAISLGNDFQEFMLTFNKMVEDLYYSTPIELSKIYDVRVNEMPNIDNTFISYIDLLDFLLKLQDKIDKESKLYLSIEEFKSYFYSIIVNQHSLGKYKRENLLNGVSINFPYNEETWGLFSDENRYPKLKISQETLWNDFIEKIVSYSSDKENK